MPQDKYLDWLKKVGSVIKTVLKDDGSLFLNMGNKPKNPWVAWDVANVFRQDFILQNVIHWVKSIAINKQDVGKYPNIVDDVAVGHFKPIISNRFLNDCHEYIFHFTKTGKVELDRLSIGVPYKDKSNIKRWKGVKEDKRCRGNVWLIPYKTIQSSKDDRPHPASFPITLPDMCIRLHGLEITKLVLDPFLGIGSTAIAAMKLKKKFIGFEIDKEYFKESCNSIKKLEEDNV